MTASAIVAVLLEVSWRAVFVAAMVGGVLWLWRVKGGAARHAAWTASMVVMLLMPALMAVVPSVSVPVPMPSFPTIPAEASGAVDVPAPVRDSRTDAVVATSAPVASTVEFTASSVTFRPNAVTRAAVTWPQVAVALWLVGVAVNLLVMMMGWRLAVRLIASARVSEIDPRVMESSAVVAPCAVGLWRVRVLVPQAWRTWSRAGRDAVLVHELSHVARRDLVVAFVARLNRAVFWFHPMAWWLERRIAAAAEQACDEAVLQAGQDPQRYASVLVEMAKSLRGAGSRVAWQSIGMVNGSDLESRVDRVLTGTVPRLSRSRAVGVVTAATVAVVAAIGCQRRPVEPTPPPLAENPEITARMQRDVESRAAGNTARSMTPDEVHALTEQVIANPDDRALVDRLVRYYSAQWDFRPGTTFVPSTTFLDSHRRVVLWAIEHKPESSLVQWRMPRAADPTGYDAARLLWARLLTSKDVSVRNYEQAILFTLLSDPVAAERMVMDARRRFPRVVKTDGTLGGSLERTWGTHLGRVYARVMLGTFEYPFFFPFGQPNPALAASPEAQRVRAIVDASSDAAMVGAVGEELAGARQDASRPLHFDAKSVGLAYLRRSLELDPDQPWRQVSLERKEWQLFLASQTAKVRAATGLGLEQLPPAQVMALPEDLQWTTLPYLAERAYAKAMSRGFQNHRDNVWSEYLGRARSYSDRAITLLQRRNDPGVVRMQYDAHVVRGWAAIADNDRARAITHLNAAIDALVAKPITLMDGRGPLHTLTNYLIKAGDTGPVADAFDRLAALGEEDMAEFKKSAEDLRAGRMPDQYQRMMAWLEEQKR
ncbi:MAG: M56 family metallopeptidase [Acidobacteria bacterium]|jgi:beta-lactamase regulating signal transducer with metallopeptidase domain|nr:M56 family metallopeptidase [Acidobacteriota bacterium]